MPGNLSDYAENKILDLLVRGVAFSALPAVFVSLHTASPTDANIAGTEVTLAAWPSYVRLNAANAGLVGTGFTVAAAGALSNAQLLTWPANNGAGSVVVSHVGIYDAAVAGNLLWWMPATAIRTLQTGDILSIAVGTLALALD